jgi:hypothetical protein
VQSLKSGERKILFPGDCAWYLPTGHLVYTVGNNLFAIPFDLAKLNIAGDPVSLDRNIYRLWDRSPQYAISITDSGTLVYIPNARNQAPQKFVIVANWFEDLRQKLLVN